jgi:hypothetical protein
MSRDFDDFRKLRRNVNLIDSVEEVVRRFLENETLAIGLQRPQGIPATFKWRNFYFVGSVQHVATDYSSEIVFVSKTNSPIAMGFINELSILDSGRLRLKVADHIDFTGRTHLLRLVGDTLVQLTPEQTEHMIEHPIIPVDVKNKKIKG